MSQLLGTSCRRDFTVVPTATGMARGGVFSINAGFWTKRETLLATSTVLSILCTRAVENVLPVSNQRHIYQLIIRLLFD